MIKFSSIVTKNGENCYYVYYKCITLYFQCTFKADSLSYRLFSLDVLKQLLAIYRMTMSKNRATKQRCSMGHWLHSIIFYYMYFAQVIHARSRNSLSYTKYWSEYAEGFGDPTTDYWIGAYYFTFL